MAVFQEFHDPRLVALYDSWGTGREDTAFYLALAAELAATSIVDIGCGTGEIACAIAQRGHRVTGIDPAPAMLEVARNRPGGDLVRWIEGVANDLDGPPADFVIMTAHLAQVIHDQDAWRDTLAAAHRALRPVATSPSKAVTPRRARGSGGLPRRPASVSTCRTARSMRGSR